MTRLNSCQIQENPFWEEINLTTGQKLTRHDVSGGMGNAGFCLHPESHEAKYEQEKNQEAMDNLMTMC